MLGQRYTYHGGNTYVRFVSPWLCLTDMCSTDCQNRSPLGLQTSPCSLGSIEERAEQAVERSAQCVAYLGRRGAGDLCCCRDVELRQWRRRGLGPGLCSGSVAADVCGEGLDVRGRADV